MITTDSDSTRAPYSFIEYTRESVVVSRDKRPAVAIVDPRHIPGSPLAVHEHGLPRLPRESPSHDDSYQSSPAALSPDRFVTFLIVVYKRLRLAQSVFAVDTIVGENNRISKITEFTDKPEKYKHYYLATICNMFFATCFCLQPITGTGLQSRSSHLERMAECDLDIRMASGCPMPLPKMSSIFQKNVAPTQISFKRSIESNT